MLDLAPEPGLPVAEPEPQQEETPPPPEPVMEPFPEPEPLLEPAPPEPVPEPLPEPPPPEPAAEPSEVALPVPPPPPPRPPALRPPPRPQRPVAEVPRAAAPAASAPVAAAAPVPNPAPVSNAVPTWQGQLLGRLQRFKRYPDHARFRREEGVTYLTFSMDRAGHVLAAAIARTSGSTALDSETLALVRRAEPLPAPPPEMPGDAITLTVPVRFSLR
jgi:protein TonB